MTKSHQTNRRRFLKTGALAAVAAPTIIPHPRLAKRANQRRATASPSALLAVAAGAWV